MVTRQNHNYLQKRICNDCGNIEVRRRSDKVCRIVMGVRCGGFMRLYEPERPRNVKPLGVVR